MHEVYNIYIYLSLEDRSNYSHPIIIDKQGVRVVFITTITEIQTQTLLSQGTIETHPPFIINQDKKVAAVQLFE